jgi:endonuclease YncB( thermonuclease family)
LNCIRVPPFIPGGGAEPFSFEARERLRKLLIGQNADIVVDGATHDRFFGTIFLGNHCVNELLLSEGFAKVVDPICGKKSERIEMLRKARANAMASQIGVHGINEPPALIVC